MLQGRFVTALKKLMALESFAYLASDEIVFENATSSLTGKAFISTYGHRLTLWVSGPKILDCFDFC